MPGAEEFCFFPGLEVGGVFSGGESVEEVLGFLSLMVGKGLP